MTPDIDVTSSVSPCLIDHIIITAPNLAVGAQLVQEALGVMPQTGGEHPRMGTHNLLLRLGDAMFLEVISANPRAAAPTRPRWFALDTLHPDSAPMLTHWVARTGDIHAAGYACSEALGNIEPMSRGELNWLITIPADGVLPLHGLAPALIQWTTAQHPALKLQDHGLSLARLEFFHPEPERVSRLLSSIGLEGAYSVAVTQGAARLVAHINTPQGLRSL